MKTIIVSDESSEQMVNFMVVVSDSRSQVNQAMKESLSSLWKESNQKLRKNQKTFGQSLLICKRIAQNLGGDLNYKELQIGWSFILTMHSK